MLHTLSSNVLEVTGEGGQIIMSCAPIKIGHATVVEIGVSAARSRIAADCMTRVGALFVQIETQRRRRAYGTGFGLSISRDLARAMVGDQTVASELDTGSTFTAHLPAATPSTT